MVGILKFMTILNNMDYTKFIKTEKLPGIWCQGCALPSLLYKGSEVFTELGYKKNNTVVVSGIGCTGRLAGFFNLDSVHTIHGRALPIAEGIKIGNPNLNVVVISGDGDLLGIGGNHLLHSSRRDPNITVICYNNEIFGLTGGQTSARTRVGSVTITSPEGSKYNRVNVYGIVTSNRRYFYGRASIFDINHLKEIIKQAVKYKGFSFVEVMGFCFESDGRRRGFKKTIDMINDLKSRYKIVKNKKDLKEDELGIVVKK